MFALVRAADGQLEGGIQMMRRVASILLILLAMSVTSAEAGGTALSGPANAQIETQGKSHYIVTRSRKFELTQFADHEIVRTAVVEAEISHRQMLSEDLGANG